MALLQLVIYYQTNALFMTLLTRGRKTFWCWEINNWTMIIFLEMFLRYIDIWLVTELVTNASTRKTKNSVTFLWNVRVQRNCGSSMFIYYKLSRQFSIIFDYLFCFVFLCVELCLSCWSFSSASQSVRLISVAKSGIWPLTVIHFLSNTWVLTSLFPKDLIEYHVE